jgi:uncharacterized protein (DUF58 family)
MADSPEGLRMQDREQLINEIDSEVKRVADLFRFILHYKEQFQPSGVEFSNLRQYMPSDDASRIDWKASARSNDLYVKEYDVETDTDTFILVDTSDTMTFGTADKLKSEYAALMAATLAYASVDIGQKVGLGMYGGDGTLITPERGQTQYHLILRELVNQDNYGGQLNLEEALKDVIGRLKPNTTVFLLSDFLDIEGEWKANMKLANSKFRHMMTTMVRDLRDYKLPDSGNVRFEAPGGGSKQVFNTTKMKDEYEKRAAEQEQHIREKATGAGSNFLKIDTRDSFGAEFASYFNQSEVEW